jgi:hypothetical protein
MQGKRRRKILKEGRRDKEKYKRYTKRGEQGQKRKISKEKSVIAGPIERVPREIKRLKRRLRHGITPTATTVSARHAFVYETQGSRQWAGVGTHEQRAKQPLN